MYISFKRAFQLLLFRILIVLKILIKIFFSCLKLKNNKVLISQNKKPLQKKI